MRGELERDAAAAGEGEGDGMRSASSELAGAGAPSDERKVNFLRLPEEGAAAPATGVVDSSSSSAAAARLAGVAICAFSCTSRQLWSCHRSLKLKNGSEML